MSKIKSELHHWWPRCVSQHWTDKDGKTGWIRSDGSEKRLLPHALGAIGNAHHVKLGKDGNDFTDWDDSFEKAFDKADSNFPQLIKWLTNLEHSVIQDVELSKRFVKQDASDDQLRSLTESIVSLAIRAPKNREACVSLAENLRGPIKGLERNALIGLNMRNSQKMLTDSIGIKGKFAVLYSASKEFIYGDGFYHNVAGLINPPHNPRLLVPLTPSISIIISRPSSYRPEPRFSSIVLTAEEVDLCNRTVQVYSRDSLFYRNEKPEVIDDFRQNKFLRYIDPDPMDMFFRGLPGLITSSRSLPFL